MSRVQFLQFGHLYTPLEEVGSEHDRVREKPSVVLDLLYPLKIFLRLDLGLKIGVPRALLDSMPNFLAAKTSEISELLVLILLIFLLASLVLIIFLGLMLADLTSFCLL